MSALLSSPTIRAAARTAGIGERTIHRYLADPEFTAELRKRQDAILAATTAALVGLAGDAVETLRDVLQDTEASHSVKLRAAATWLSHTRGAVELDDLARRVSALERTIGQNEH